MQIAINNNRIITWVIIGLSLLIVMMPLIMHNDVLTSILDSTDYSTHTDAIRQYSETGQISEELYIGQRIMAVLLSPWADSENLDNIYLGVSFAVLVLMVITLYAVVNKLAGKTSALLVLPMVLFCTPSIISLFKYGVIFSIINMYIILPLAISASVIWIKDSKWWWYLDAIVLFGIFSVFHFTSMYLAWSLGIAIVAYSIYCIVKKQKDYIMNVLLLGIPAIVINLVLSSMLLDSNVAEVAGYSLSFDVHNILSMFQVITSHLYLVPIFLICGIFVVWLPKYGMKSMGIERNILLVVLLSFVIALCGGIMLEVTKNIIYINRMATDLAVLLTISVACVIGYIMDTKQSKALKYAVFIIVAAGSIPIITHWI